MCSFRKCVLTHKASIARVDIMKGYKGCSCQSVHIERWYNGCKVYTTKQKSLVGLARNVFQVCDHSAMNTLNVGVSPISPYTFLYIVFAPKWPFFANSVTYKAVLFLHPFMSSVPFHFPHL